MGTTVSDRIVAFARVVGAVCCHRADLFVGWYLAEQLRQHGCIPDAAAGHLNCAYLQCLFVDSDVYLAPKAALGTAMLACVPLIT